MATKTSIVNDDDIQQDVQTVSNQKHTLDSDEEDDEDYERDYLEGSDVEGEEEGVATVQDEIKITPFNMREELEEGHFDTEGNYHWAKDSDIHDNWLDNIDWVKIKETKKKDEDDDDDGVDMFKDVPTFDINKSYKELLSYMSRSETINQTIIRLGKSRPKLSTAERMKMKKLNKTDEFSEKITKISEIANEILSQTGNMDLYEMTYEAIEEKLNCSVPTSSKVGEQLKRTSSSSSPITNPATSKKVKLDHGTDSSRELLWEYKTKLDDTELHGPFTSQQMLKLSEKPDFKDGVYVKKVGIDSSFYNSKRIDFDLYC